MKKLVLSTVILLTLSLSFTSCRDSKKADSVEEAVENAAEATGEVIEDAAEAVEDAAVATGEAVEDAAESANKEIEKVKVDH